MAGNMNLVEMGKDADPLTKDFVEIYAKNSDILDAITYTSDGVAAGAYRYNTEGAGPTMAFRGLNESYVSSIGVLNPQVETLKIAGGEFKVDTAIVRWQGQGKRAKLVRSQQKSMARLITDKFLKGDNTSDNREIDGLQRRLPLTGSQTIANTNASGGAALKLSKILELQDVVRNSTHWIMNKELRRAITMAQSDVNVSGYLTQDEDRFGRIVWKLAGKPILVGYESGPEGAILPFTEANFGGGSAVATSIYLADLSEDGVQMLQSEAPIVKDLGEMESEPQWLTRAEWDLSPVVENPYSIGRLSSIIAGAMTRN